MSIVGGSQSRLNGILKGPSSKSPGATTDVGGAMNKYGHPENNANSKRMSSIDTSPAKMSITPNKYNPAIGARNMIARSYNETVDEKALAAEDYTKKQLGADTNTGVGNKPGTPSTGEPGTPGKLPTEPKRDEGPKPKANPKRAPNASIPNIKLPNIKLPKFK